jgi:hypothetical protein
MTQPLDEKQTFRSANARDRAALREIARSEMLAKAPPSLSAVTWQQLAWAVEDRMEGKAGSSSDLRRATVAAINELSRKGVLADLAVDMVRTLILRLAGVPTGDTRRAAPSSGARDNDVARAS